MDSLIEVLLAAATLLRDPVLASNADVLESSAESAVSRAVASLSILVCRVLSSVLKSSNPFATVSFNLERLEAASFREVFVLTISEFSLASSASRATASLSILVWSCLSADWRTATSLSIAVLLSATSFTSPPVLSPTVVLRSFTSFLRPLSSSPTADSSLLIFSVLLRMFFAFVLMAVAFVLMLVAKALSAPSLVYTSTAADVPDAGSTLIVTASSAQA